MAKLFKFKNGEESLFALEQKDFIIKKGVLYGLADELKYYIVDPDYKRSNKTKEKIPNKCVTVSKEECTHIIIPNNVTTINSYAFSNAKKLNTVEMCSVKYIQDHAFFACNALKDIDLFGVEQIESGSFIGCTNLSKTIVQPSCVIEKYSFDDKYTKIDFFKNALYSYEQLANAIIEQAAFDYMNNIDKPYCSRQSITKFFRSDYFKKISNANPEYIIKNLNKLIKEK